MELGFDRDDILGDIAEGLRAEQGTGFKKTLLYEIQDKAGHPVNTSDNWYEARNLLDFYAALTLVKIFGPTFANRSLARLGFKLVPLASAKVDATALKADIDRGIAIIQGVSCEISRAIEHGGGDAKEGEAA